MKVLITGANGQLGHDLREVLADHTLFPYDLDMNVTDAKAVSDTVMEVKPDIIIHSAAMTNVDGCETDPDQAFLVNGIGTGNIALAAKKASSRLVYVSTDFVFDGSKGEPYTEFDEPNPISAYGKSKRAGEEFVEALVPEHFIVRTAWLFGKTGHNFVKTMVKLADEKDELKVVDDQIGSPTYSADLAARINELIATDWFGTYHVTNSGSCSWYEFARAILQKAGKGTKVTPITSKELDRPAPRPAYSVLRNYVSELRGFQPMRPFEEALDAFFA